MSASALRARAPLALLCAVHALGLLFLLDRPAFWFTEHPILNADWGLHYHHLRSLAGFWESDGRLWGYNPFHMAGYPSNTFQDLSVKLFEIAAVWAPIAKPVVAFKVLVFLATASVPIVVYATYRTLFSGAGDARSCGSRSGALLAALLGTAYWWNSFPREMFFYGMVGFPIACYVAFLAIALLGRALESERRFSKAHFGWLAACALLVPLHVQACVVALVPGAVLLLGAKRPRRALWAIAAVPVAAVANGFWLLPALAHIGDDVSREIITHLPIYNSHDPWTFLKDYFTAEVFWTNRTTMAFERALRIAIAVLGVAGLVEMARRGRRVLAAALAAAALAFFLVAYFGSFVEWLAPWQPLRFKVPLDIALLIAAAYAVRPADSDGAPADAEAPPARGPSGSLRARWKRAVLLVGLLGCAVNVFLTERSGAMRLKTAFEPPATDVVRWLYTIVPRTGRVLFEESGDESDFVYGETYLGAFLPHTTGHQLIGGPINLYNDRHHHAEFHSGMLFKRGIWRYSDDELRRAFETYNVIAIVAFHPFSIRRLGALGDLVTPLEKSGNVVLFRVNREPNWFLSGSGHVEAGLDGLECSGVSGSGASGNEVVLAYHWVDGLVSRPDARIEPIHLLDDPIPFVKVVNPPPELTLSVGGRARRAPRNPGGTEGNG